MCIWCMCRRTAVLNYIRCVWQCIAVLRYIRCEWSCTAVVIYIWCMCHCSAIAKCLGCGRRCTGVRVCIRCLRCISHLPAIPFCPRRAPPLSILHQHPHLFNPPRKIIRLHSLGPIPPIGPLVRRHLPRPHNAPFWRLLHIKPARVPLFEKGVGRVREVEGAGGRVHGAVRRRVDVVGFVCGVAEGVGVGGKGANWWVGVVVSVDGC